MDYFDLQDITFTEGNDRFKMEPIEFYYTKRIRISRPIFFYKFTHEKLDDVTNKIEAIIPLYMSDGKTNSYRGNLLLPFLCIQSDDNTDSCPIDPYNRYPYGMVYKLDPCKDIDGVLIHKNIIDNIKRMYDTDGNEYEKTEEYINLHEKNLQGKDLFSVLPRMESFILFLLNILT